MKKIRDASTIIGMLENGQLNPAFSAEIGQTLEKLSDMSEANPCLLYTSPSPRD